MKNHLNLGGGDADKTNTHAEDTGTCPAHNSFSCCGSGEHCDSKERCDPCDVLEKKTAHTHNRNPAGKAGKRRARK